MTQPKVNATMIIDNWCNDNIEQQVRGDQCLLYYSLTKKICDRNWYMISLSQSQTHLNSLFIFEIILIVCNS